jgi:hypothetical protein
MCLAYALFSQSGFGRGRLYAPNTSPFTDSLCDPSKESVCDNEGEAGSGGTRGARLDED